MENPYQGPKSEVADATLQYQPVRILSVSGRIGRLRFIAYSFGLSLLVASVGGILTAMLSSFQAATTLVMIVTWVLILAISIALTIQRSHDFNASGWLAILGVIPLVNLIFWFIPGTDGPNRFGGRPPPNSWLTVIVVCIVPAIFVIGIIAAIALPAYQEYAKRAAPQQTR